MIVSKEYFGRGEEKKMRGMCIKSRVKVRDYKFSGAFYILWRDNPAILLIEQSKEFISTRPPEK